MKSEELQDNMLSTYFWLRGGIVFLSVALPLILYFGGRFRADLPLLNSMSAYYGEDNGLMRNWFVGILWSVGSFLVLYQGFSEVEDVLLNAAGGFAVGVAMIPCNCWNGAVGGSNKLHALCAVAFFLCMAAVCVFCAEDTVNLLPDQKTKNAFKRQYRTIAILLVASPVVAIAASYTLDQNTSAKFFVEAVGVWVVAYYWWTKSREFRKTSAEKLAVHGKLENRRGVGLVWVEPAPLP